MSSSISAVNRNGNVDDECYKKIQTDALTKALSRLGFNADIFMGLWDDNRYVEQVKKKKEGEKAAANAVEIKKAIDDAIKKAKSFVKAGDVESIRAIVRSNPELMKDKAFMDGITAIGKQAAEVSAKLSAEAAAAQAAEEDKVNQQSEKEQADANKGQKGAEPQNG
jgi:hypothetical protein